MQLPQETGKDVEITILSGEDGTVDNNAQIGYNNLSELLTQKTFSAKGNAFLLTCAVVAALASAYNFEFSQQYMGDTAKTRFDFDQAWADAFGIFCGTMGLVVNTAINGNSLKQAYEVIRTEIFKKNGTTWRPEDRNYHRMLIAEAAVSLVGAVPNLKFVYDTAKKNGLFYLILMEIIQFATMSALNFRGLYNTFKINSEKKESASDLKLRLLTKLNACLDKDHVLTPEELAALSQGELVKQRLPKVRLVVKGFFWLYVIPYSMAFGLAVKMGLPDLSTGLFVDRMYELGVKDPCGLLAIGLKGFLLGNAYGGLTDQIFDLFQNPALKVNQNEVRSQFISRSTDRVLAVIGLTLAVFTIGTSSKIVEKYYFPSGEKDLFTFLVSILLGGVAAYGINAGDLRKLLEQCIDTGAYFGRYVMSKFKKDSIDPLYHYGSTHIEYIMRVMLAIASMKEDEVLKKFADEVTAQNVNRPGNRSSTEEASDDYRMIVHGYRPNNFFRTCTDSCAKLANVLGNASFIFFKNQKREEIRQRREAAQPQPSPNAKDEKSPLLKDANLVMMSHLSK